MKKLACLMLMACGQTNEPNPCADKNAEYELNFLQLGFGTCGSAKENTTTKFDGNNEACDDYKQIDSCTVHKKGCHAVVNGISCITSEIVNFAKDGASGIAYQVATCTGPGLGLGCTSAYEVTITKAKD